MSTHPNILFVGAGSGGHIFPLIAVWEQLMQLSPKSTYLFVCSKRPEDSAYLHQHNIQPVTLEAPRNNPFIFVKTYRAAKKLLREHQPDVVFSKGGSLSIAVCLAARRLNIPVVLHESDAVMGRANKLISRWADVICTGMPIPAVRALKFSNMQLTGNPIRPSVMGGDPKKGYALTGFSGKRPVILIYGGSQGAKVINQWTKHHLEELLSFADVIHLTGHGKEGATPQKGYFRMPFAAEELPHLYAISTFAVSRAGSGTISELAAYGIPAVLVPIKGLAQDHQVRNAKLAEMRGGCIALDQDLIDKELLTAIRVTLLDEKKYHIFASRMKLLHHPEAAKSIARHLLEAAKKHLPERAKSR